MSRHRNIPVFIPHEGCPNNCVFCNQHSITGTDGTADRDIRPEIERALETCADNEVQIAFFGGSFTGIDRALMTRLLDDAFAYVRAGKVASLRLSTRPDYISAEILDLLKSHGVQSIELGLQSMSDRVLTACQRGHTGDDARRACAQIKAYGFELTGQMMLGLPESSLADELDTAQALADMGCDCARIYPTVVFENTELCAMARDGRYKPLTVEDAVRRGAAVYEVLVRRGVLPLRIGLQATETLCTGEDVYAGPNHSALGELIEGEYYFRRMCAELDLLCRTLSDGQRTLVLHCAPGEQSKVAGQRKRNKTRLAALLADKGFQPSDIRIYADARVKKNEIRYGAL